MGMTPAERTAAYRQRKYILWATLPRINCACGCNTTIPPINKKGQPARYAHGHNPDGKRTQFKKGAPSAFKGRKGPPSSRKGLPLNRESLHKRQQTRNNRFGDKYFGVPMAGENCPAWKGGVSTLPYGPEFTDRFKKLIRQRDGARCGHCGKTRKQEIKKLNRELSVHHIDHDKTNNDPSNLVTVCTACNFYFSRHRDESLIAFPLRKMLLS